MAAGARPAIVRSAKNNKNDNELCTLDEMEFTGGGLMLRFDGVGANGHVGSKLKYGYAGHEYVSGRREVY
jgi:hypothetical protein